MKIHISILLFLLIGLSAFAQPIDKRLAKIDKELNEVLTTWNAPGFAVAVVEKDKIIYAKGFGYRDYENKVPADANTLYAIGSCTKSFTSSLLGILRKDKLVSFDESPRKYIPYLKFHNDQMDNDIIVNDLMTHRTGLPRHDLSWYMSNTTNRDSLMMRVQYMEPFTGVREKWYYNNFMFLAQGVIAEKITGKSWEENISQYFLKPLGMSRSNAGIQEMKDASNAALGYGLKDNKINKLDYYDISGMAPAGSINSSVNDMANWVITWINGGKYKGKEIIPADYVTEAMSSQMVIAGALPKSEDPGLFMANYGYGWFASSYKGHYMVQHGGNIDGFSANTSFFPSDSVGIIVLTNQNGSAVPSVVRNIMADKVLGLAADNWNAKAKEQADKQEKTRKEARESATSSRVEGTNPSHNLISYTGTYNNKGYGKFKVALVRDSLFLQFPAMPKMKLWLQHYHYDIFKPNQIDEQGKIDDTQAAFDQMRISFTTNTQGEIDKLLGNFEPALDHPIEFVRKPNEIKVEAKVLETYVGEYNLAGTTVKVFIKDKDKLYVFVPGQPEYELASTGKNQFTIKILNGYNLEFLSEEKGHYKELLFKQPNGNFKATRK